MIKAVSENKKTELKISGNSVTILNELYIIIAKLLESFNMHGDAEAVLQVLVDAAEDFNASIKDKNSNSKGEKKDD